MGVWSASPRMNAYRLADCSGGRRRGCCGPDGLRSKRRCYAGMKYHSHCLRQLADLGLGLVITSQPFEQPKICSKNTIECSASALTEEYESCWTRQGDWDEEILTLGEAEKPPAQPNPNGEPAVYGSMCGNMYSARISCFPSRHNAS
jgi:hypothetical protein